MKRLLLTGGMGFIGRQVQRALGVSEFAVHAISRHRSTTPLSNGVSVHTCDLMNPAEVQQVVRMIQPSHLLHLGWYTQHRRFWTAPENLDWAAATLNLFRAFQENGGERFVGVGSCAEYDWSGGWCSETGTAIRPTTLYGVAKDAVRRCLEMGSRGWNGSWAWGRVFFMYGPEEPHDKFVASIARPLLLGKHARCGAPDLRRDYMHVADVAGALIAVLRSVSFGPVNISSGEAVPLAEIARKIGALTGRGEFIEYGEFTPSPENPPLIAGLASRLEQEFGFKPRFSLDTGLAETVFQLEEDIRTNTQTAN